MADCNYKILEEVGVISGEQGKWTKELNVVSWYGKEASLELRNWGPDKNKAGTGITLTKKDLIKLVELAKDYLKDEIVEQDTAGADPLPDLE